MAVSKYDTQPAHLFYRYRVASSRSACMVAFFSRIDWQDSLAEGGLGTRSIEYNTGRTELVAER